MRRNGGCHVTSTDLTFPLHSATLDAHASNSASGGRRRYHFDDLDLKEDPPAVEEMASCNHCAGGRRRGTGSCPTCNGRGVVRVRTTTIRDKQGRVRSQWREFPDLDPVHYEYQSYSTDDGCALQVG
jgi:hypothetical protein